jgi:alkylation response protein AidB-like acyl-CoA dehydrogenase
LDFSLPPELLALERSVTTFARKQHKGRPPSVRVATTEAMTAMTIGGGHQTNQRFDRVGWNACARFGIHGLPIAEAHDGLGQGMLACVVALRAYARECPQNGLLFALCNHLGATALSIQRYGTDAQQDEYLPDLASGVRVAGAQLMPTSSDRAPGVVVRAIRNRNEGDSGFTLDGALPLVCNAPVADLFLVVADSSQSVAVQPTKSVSDVPVDAPKTAFLVPRDTPGLMIHESALTRGLYETPVARVSFTSVSLPSSAVLGGLHQGCEVLASGLSHMLCLALACQVGRMQRQVQRCVTHARDRRQFGRPIGSFQAISHALADMQTRTEIACMTVERLAWKLERGEPALMDAAMAKTVVTESYIQSSRTAMQVHGGSGIMRETDLERDLSDALVSHAYLGASEVPRDIIAHFLLGIEPLDL